MGARTRIVVAVVLALIGVAEVQGADPLTLERVLWGTSARRFWPTFEDYDGDGVQDLIGRVSANGAIRMRILSGANGATIRQYDAPPGGDFTTRAGTIPDIDGDGMRDLVFGGHTNVWAIGSAAGGGQINTLAGPYAFSNLDYGVFLATGDNRSLIASCDRSTALLIDSRTGAVQARISNYLSYGYSVGSLGQSALSLGDLNGDGIEDFATSGGNVNNNPGPMGTVYIISGRTTTTGTAFVPLQNLPAGSVLAQLKGTEFLGAGQAMLADQTTVNLGDPYPDNGKTEWFLVSGGPWGNYECGGMAAHVLTLQPDGTFTVQTVAAYTHTAKEHYARAVLSLGDVNGDGVGDVAIVSDPGGSSTTRGRIQVVSGAALLDGFQSSTDVLQTIDGVSNAFFYEGVQGLGDYDHDGRKELAMNVLYNGLGGVFGDSIHIYEVVPEPASLALLTLGGLAVLLKRRK